MAGRLGYVLRMHIINIGTGTVNIKQKLENFTSKSLGPDPDPTVPKMFRIHNTAKYVCKAPIALDGCRVPLPRNLVQTSEGSAINRYIGTIYGTGFICGSCFFAKIVYQRKNM
jgi:hypothetical protein